VARHRYLEKSREGQIYNRTHHCKLTQENSREKVKIKDHTPVI